MVSSISGINSSPELNVSTSKAKAEQGEFDAILKAAQNEKDEKKLLEQCKQLESVFVNMMFKQMQSTVEKSSLIDGGFGEEVYNDMLTEQYADKATQGNGIGLAQVMFKQLSKNITNKSEG
jgi:flagellar protein FlgJ